MLRVIRWTLLLQRYSIRTYEGRRSTEHHIEECYQNQGSMQWILAHDRDDAGTDTDRSEKVGAAEYHCALGAWCGV
jgi:hypothetical protein